MSTPPAIQTRDLTRYYGATIGVEGLTLEVEPGEIFGFLGPNGSGKTTTIRLLLDHVRPSRGDSSLFGFPSRDPSSRGRVGYLPGELALDGRMTGTQTLRFLADLRRSGPVADLSRRREELCHRLGLPPEDMARRVREYSRGMKQKLGLVAALQHHPDLLILDEPTTGLDPLVREVVFELLAEAKGRGATVFHSSHVLTEVERSSDRVGVLREGHMVALLTMEEARKAATRVVVVEFRDEPSLEELAAAGMALERREGPRLVLKIVGQMSEVLAMLARHPIHHLSLPEPRLEDAFQALYRGSGPRR